MSESDHHHRHHQEYNKCQMLLANLYLHLKKTGGNTNSDPIQNSKLTIAQVMDTAVRCGDRLGYNNLSHIREATEEKINRTDKNRLDRIINCEANKKDETIVQRVAHEYRTWYTTELKKSLSWKTWVDCDVLTPTFYQSVGLGLATAGTLSALKYSSSSWFHICAVSVGVSVLYSSFQDNV